MDLVEQVKSMDKIEEELKCLHLHQGMMMANLRWLKLMVEHKDSLPEDFKQKARMLSADIVMWKEDASA